MRPHPLCKLVPPLTDAEFEALVEDIRVNGLRFPIVVCADGKQIIDGYHRYRALKRLGITPKAHEHVEHTLIHADDWDRIRAFVLSANIHRRQLPTAADKDKVVADLIAAAPEKSDRQIAKAAKVDHHKVAKLRKEAEATGEAPPVDKRIGADGKARRKPKRRKPAPAMQRHADKINQAWASVPDALKQEILEDERAVGVPATPRKSEREFYDEVDNHANEARLAAGAIEELFKWDWPLDAEEMEKFNRGTFGSIIDHCRRVAEQWARLAEKIEKMEQTQGNGIDPDASAQERKAAMAAE